MSNEPRTTVPPPLRIPLRRTPSARRTPPRTLRALGLSLGAHAAFGLLFAAVATYDLRRSVPPTPPPAAELASYLDLAAWPPPGARDAAAVVPETEGAAADAERTARSAPVLPPPGTRSDAAVRTAADPAPTDAAPAEAPARATRLRPALGDPRLIIPTRPLPDRLPPESERHLAAFQAALRTVRDSLQDHVDRERRVNSWAWTDPDGRAWGVRNGLLFIAGKPAIYVEMQGARDHEIARRAQAWQREEGRRQDERIERERHLSERARAMRARSDALRASESP